MLRKIPLGPFIEILQDLFDNGADFIDLAGDESDKGETPRDTIKITVKPEYLSPEEEEEEENDDDNVINHEMDFLIDNGNDVINPLLSDNDIEDLI